MKKHRPRRRRVAFLLFLIVIAIVVVLLWSTEWLVSLGGRVTGARLERARRSPQFSDGKFRNPEPTRMATASMREMAKRQFFGDEQREPLGVVPVLKRTAQDYATPPPSGLRATWIGWSSVLVEIDGRRVLTDPVWSERCSPSTLVGPKRFHATPIALADLPPIDAVVISHDHYDHLDMPVVRALAARGTHFVVPLGIGAHLERWNVAPSQIHELDWTESAALNGLTITSTRAALQRTQPEARQRDALVFVGRQRPAPSRFLQRRLRILGGLRGDRRAARSVRSHADQDRRLGSDVVGDSHDAGGSGSDTPRPPGPGDDSGALGHLQSRVPRVGRSRRSRARRGREERSQTVRAEAGRARGAGIAAGPGTVVGFLSQITNAGPFQNRQSRVSLASS